MFSQEELKHEEAILIFKQFMNVCLYVATGFILDFLLNELFWKDTQYLTYSFNRLISSWYSFFILFLILTDFLRFDKIRKKYREKLKKGKKDKNINTC